MISIVKLTLCSNKDCNSKSDCARFTPNQYILSAVFVEDNDGTCAAFIDRNIGEDNGG